jgi:hypothetical protein
MRDPVRQHDNDTGAFMKTKFYKDEAPERVAGSPGVPKKSVFGTPGDLAPMVLSFLIWLCCLLFLVAMQYMLEDVWLGHLHWPPVKKATSVEHLRVRTVL